MGFSEAINAIIANLPVERQTLLFSATQTKSVKDLSRLSLKDPSYVTSYESAVSTPKNLSQHYAVCELHEKLTFLWSFIRNHRKSKIIVFLASCNQVKFVYEIFSKLRPGISLSSLHGRLHQLKRMDIFENFRNKNAAVLLATDLASRGLDFPNVDWVIQLDCPEDVPQYIHRVGRTARLNENGQGILVLLPSEKAFLNNLQENKIPIDDIE